MPAPQLDAPHGRQANPTVVSRLKYPVEHSQHAATSQAPELHAMLLKPLLGREPVALSAQSKDWPSPPLPHVIGWQSRLSAPSHPPASK